MKGVALLNTFCRQKIFIGMTFFSLCGMPHFALGMSLQEAIKNTFDHNPRMQANQKRLEEIKLHALAAWLDMLPILTLGYSVGHRERNLKLDGVVFPHPVSHHRGGSVGGSVLLFDGASYFRARAAEAEVKIQSAIYNSTNALRPNTKGALASAVQSTYSAIVLMRMQLELVAALRNHLEHFLRKATTPDERNRLQEAINSTESSRISTELRLDILGRDFADLVMAPVPAELDDLDVMIASLIVPETLEEAQTEAAKSSPDLRVRNFELERQKQLYRAQVASVYLPRVSLDYSREANRTSYVGGPLEEIRGSSVSAAVTWTFSAGNIPRTKAAAKAVEAAQLDVAAEKRDLDHDLETTYRRRSGSVERDRLLTRNLAEIRANLKNFLDRLEQGEPVDLTKDGLGMVNSLSNTWGEWVENKVRLVELKFDIQKKIGTLFEDVNQYLNARPPSGSVRPATSHP